MLLLGPGPAGCTVQLVQDLHWVGAVALLAGIPVAAVLFVAVSSRQANSFGMCGYSECLWMRCRRERRGGALWPSVVPSLFAECRTYGIVCCSIKFGSKLPAMAVARSSCGRDHALRASTVAQPAGLPVSAPPLLLLPGALHPPPPHPGISARGVCCDCAVLCVWHIHGPAPCAPFM